MAGERIPRVRLSSPIREPLLVVRGDVLSSEVLGRDARRFRRRFPDWGRFGVSAFIASDEREIDALCQARLINFGMVTVFGLSDLVAVGVEVVPTFRRPHVTLAHADAEALVSALQTCEHWTRRNPYHEEGPS